jgi:acyl carrier protein
MDNVKPQVRQFLAQILPAGKISTLSDDMPLRTSGLLDSLGVLRLVSFVEEQFGIEIDAYDAGVQNFDTVNAIVAFLERKRTEKASAPSTV